MTNPPEEERAAQRASDLAETVKQEASGVSATVRDEASAIRERIEKRDDLNDELRGITEAIGTLVEHMDQSMPEERFKQLADAVLAEDRRGRRRLTVTVVGVLVVTVILGLSSFLQSAANGRTLDEAKKVAGYVEDCLQHPERLTPEQRLARCGNSDAATLKLVRGLLDGINCSLLISPEARTEANTDACAQRALGQ